MARILSTRLLTQALKAEGFALPPNCGEARIVMGVNKAWVIQYDVFMTDEDLVRFGRAMVRLGEEETRMQLQREDSPDAE